MNVCVTFASLRGCANPCADGHAVPIAAAQDGRTIRRSRRVGECQFYLYPALDRVGGVLVQQVGFVIAADAFAESQRIAAGDANRRSQATELHGRWHCDQTCFSNAFPDWPPAREGNARSSANPRVSDMPFCAGLGSTRWTISPTFPMQTPMMWRPPWPESSAIIPTCIVSTSMLPALRHNCRLLGIYS